MRKLWNLCRMQLEENHPRIFGGGNKRKLLFALIFSLAFIVITLSMHYFLDYLFKTFLIEPGFTTYSTLLTLVGAIFICTLVFSVLKRVYYSRDKELYASLPVTDTQVYVSKLLSLFLEELVTGFLIVLPLQLCYAIWAQAAVWFYVLIPLITVLFYAVCLAFASLIAIPVMYLTNLIKKSTVATFISLFVVIAGAFALYMFVIGGLLDTFRLVEQTTVTIENIRKGMAAIARFSVFFTALAQLNYFSSLLASIPIATFAVAAMLFAAIFINKFIYKSFSRLTGAKEKKKLTPTIQNKSAFKSILFKDITLLLRSPNLLFQYFLFLLIMPLFSYAFNRLLYILDLGEIGFQMVVGANILIFSLMTLLSCTYCSTAISRQGANFYLLKIAPVDFKKQLFSTLTVNYSLILLFSLVSLILVAAFSYLSVLDCLLIFLLVAVLGAGHCCASLENDLRAPTLDWYDVSQLTDNSGPTVKSMLVGIVVGAGLGFAALFSIPLIGTAACYAIVFAVALLYSGVSIGLYFRRVNYYFRRIEV